MNSQGRQRRVFWGCSLVLFQVFVILVRGEHLRSEAGVASLPRSGNKLLSSGEVGRGSAHGAELAPPKNGNRVLTTRKLSQADSLGEDDLEASDEDVDFPPERVPKGKISESSQVALAPTVSKIDTIATSPAAGGPQAANSVRSIGREESGGGLGSGAQEGNDTQSIRALNDTRKEESVVKVGKETSALGKNTSNTTVTSTEDGESDEGGETDDEEGGLIAGQDDPPRLKHRTSSFEGFGDPSKKLTLIVVCENIGGGSLEVKIVTPTWMHAEPESVRVGPEEERNITITVLDPKGLQGASEKIWIKSNGGDEYFEITRAALGRTDWKDSFPSSGGNTILVAAGATVVGLAALTYCMCRRRHQRHGSASFKYKELEMQGDLSSALGQLPVASGTGTSYASGFGPTRSGRTPTEDDSGRGWDDNWDDWDEEEQRSKR